jgi:hypothetical protein
MRALPLLLAVAGLGVGASASDVKNDGSLDSVAAVTAKSSAQPCPISLTATVTHNARGYYLTFTMKNTSGRALTLLRQHLPWGNTYSIRVAAVTTDGQLLVGGYPIDDDFGLDKVTFQSGQVLSGDYDLSHHWSDRSIPPTGFPAGKTVVLIWAYTVFADEFAKDRVPVCSGVTSFKVSG